MQKYWHYHVKIDLEINLKSSHDMPMQATRRGGSIAPTHSQPGTKKKWVVRFQPLNLRERTGAICTGGWVDLGAGLDGTEISLAPGFDPRTVPPQAIRCTHRHLEACFKCPCQQGHYFNDLRIWILFRAIYCSVFHSYVGRDSVVVIAVATS
jgi:hypothetical protein